MVKPSHLFEKNQVIPVDDHKNIKLHNNKKKNRIMTTNISSLFPMFCLVDNATEVLDLTLDLCRVATPPRHEVVRKAAKKNITPYPFTVCSYPVEEDDDDDDDDGDDIVISRLPFSRNSTPELISLPIIRASSLSTATTVSTSSVSDFYFPENNFDVGGTLSTTFSPIATKKRTLSPPPTDIFRIPTNQVQKKPKTHNEGKSVAEKRGGLVRMTQENYDHRPKPQVDENRQPEATDTRKKMRSLEERRPKPTLSRTSGGELHMRISSAMAA